MKKEMFNLDNHPKFGTREPDLDPWQKGLLKTTNKCREKKKLGDDFENKLCEMLKTTFPDDVIIQNVLFESGNYIDSLKIYESLQIDIIVVTDIGVFCIEAKWISDTKYTRISGGALSKSWTLKTKRGTTNSDINGLKQNYRHYMYLKEMFAKEKVDCPVYQMTVIGGLERKKIAVQQFIDANLVDEKEIVDRVTYIKNRNKNKNVNVKQVVNIINDWKCTIEGADILHLVYVRNIAKKKLPARCKKIMRSL